MSACYECSLCHQQYSDLDPAMQCCATEKAAITGLSGEALMSLSQAAAEEERAKVVAWLRKENGKCDCFAYEDNECACGGRDEYKMWPLEQTANYLEQGEHLK